jgi:hypothetical protein
MEPGDIPMLVIGFWLVVRPMAMERAASWEVRDCIQVLLVLRLTHRQARALESRVDLAITRAGVLQSQRQVMSLRLDTRYYLSYLRAMSRTHGDMIEPPTLQFLGETDEDVEERAVAAENDLTVAAACGRLFDMFHGPFADDSDMDDDADDGAADTDDADDGAADTDDADDAAADTDDA